MVKGSQYMKIVQKKDIFLWVIFMDMVKFFIKILQIFTKDNLFTAKKKDLELKEKMITTMQEGFILTNFAAKVYT